MKKELFKENFDSCLDERFERFNKYFDYEYKVFHDLITVVFQINKCLILEIDYATITLTNHLLERLLKLALITKAVGIRSIPISQWNTIFEGPNKKYGSLSLGNTIEQCKKEELITSSEKDMLFDTIRELMRNGFSHADTSKVLSSLPDEVSMFHGKFDEKTELSEVFLNPKIIPPFQAVAMNDFASGHAESYFEYVFQLLINIEDRLIKFDKI